MRRRANSHGNLWLLVAAALLAGAHCTSDKAQPMPFTPPEPVAFSVHVSYCTAGAPGLPVPGIHVQITSGPTPLEAITDENGDADFAMVAPGKYELAVSRATGPLDPSCISGIDINKLTQAILGARVLGECSAAAADVLQDGDVTALDLQALRRFVAFDFAHGGHTAEWRFIDVAPRVDVQGATSLDIRAVILGDVDLSWPIRG